MQAHKLTHLFIAISTSCWLLSNAANAQNSSSESPLFQVSVKREPVQRLQPPFRVFVTMGKSKFTFVTPDGFQVQDDTAQQRVILVNSEQTCTVIVRFGSPMPEGIDALDVKSCRALLLNRYPGATVVEEFSKSAANRTGPAFDLQWKTAAGMLQSARVAFIPSTAGILEISAMGTDQVQGNFNIILMNFLTGDADGKLNIPTISDQV